MRSVQTILATGLAGVALAGCGGRQLDGIDIDERAPIADSGRACLAPRDYDPCFAAVDEPLAAIGLGCSEDPSVAIPLEGPAMLLAEDPDSWRVAAYLGVAEGQRSMARYWAAREPDEGHNLDDRLLLLSTGRLPAPDALGGIIVAPSSQAAEGDNQNPDAGPLPAPLRYEPGSNGGHGGTPLHDCDGVHDCSDSLAPLLAGGAALHDRVSLHARMVVPEGTETLALDFALLSAEFPEFVDSPFSDLFVAWVDSAAFTGNLALVEGRAMTSTSLAEAGWLQHQGDDPVLGGTGFEGHGATDWLTLRVPVVEGEIVELSLLLADMGDPGVATLVVVDDLRWECEACGLIEGGCGVREADSDIP